MSDSVMREGALGRDGEGEEAEGDVDSPAGGGLEDEEDRGGRRRLGQGGMAG
jgi:hypothetical protein